MLAGAHVADRAGLLAVARQAGGGQLVERHALGAAGEERLADAGPAVQPLERPDVEVLARVRAGHDRDLGRLEVERLDAAGLDQRRRRPNGLTQLAEGDEPIRVAEAADEPPVGVDLDDVAAVDALLDAVADLADEDRRDDPRPGAGALPAERGACAAGGLGRAAGTIGAVTIRRGYRGTRARRMTGVASARCDCYDGRDAVRLPAARPASGDRRCPTPPTLHVSQHPAVLHKLAILRDEETEPKKFREVVRELSWLLGYEALADARVRPLTIRTPIEEMEARTSSASGSASSRSCGPASGWSTRCSS